MNEQYSSNVRCPLRAISYRMAVSLLSVQVWGEMIFELGFVFSKKTDKPHQ